MEGYDAFFSFSRVRPGYSGIPLRLIALQHSGVVTYCKSIFPAVLAEEGLTGFYVPPPFKDGSSSGVGSAEKLIQSFTDFGDYF